VVFENANEDFRSQIKGTTAGIVIGDRALEQRKLSPYIFDLGTAWNELTGLPFVFAAWVANKPLGAEFEDAFNRANAYGVTHIAEVVAESLYTVYDLTKYYTQNISYRLDDEKRKGLALFLEKLGKR
jgi:chorismate dehydratase